jgi:hypothetical protein
MIPVEEAPVRAEQERVGERLGKVELGDGYQCGAEASERVVHLGREPRFAQRCSLGRELQGGRWSEVRESRTWLCAAS